MSFAFHRLHTPKSNGKTISPHFTKRTIRFQFHLKLFTLYFRFEQLLSALNYIHRLLGICYGKYTHTHTICACSFPFNFLNLISPRNIHLWRLHCALCSLRCRKLYVSLSWFTWNPFFFYQQISKFVRCLCFEFCVYLECLRLHQQFNV